MFQLHMVNNNNFWVIVNFIQSFILKFIPFNYYKNISLLN